MDIQTCQHPKASVKQLPSRMMLPSDRWLRWLRWCWVFMRLLIAHSSVCRTTILKITLTESQPYILRCVSRSQMGSHLKSFEVMVSMCKQKYAQEKNLAGVVTIHKICDVQFSTKKVASLTCLFRVNYRLWETKLKNSWHASCKVVVTRLIHRTRSSIILWHLKHSHVHSQQKNSQFATTRIVHTFTVKVNEETLLSLQIQQKIRKNQTKSLRIKAIADKNKKPPIPLKAVKATLNWLSRSKRNWLRSSKNWRRLDRMLRLQESLKEKVEEKRTTSILRSTLNQL